MRKVAVAIAIIFSLVVIALLVLWLTFEVDDYRGPIQSQLEDRLGRSVKLGPMELGLFPPRFQVRNLVIEDDPGFSNPRPFIEAEQVNLALNLIPLLRGNVEITSLRLDRPVIELIRNEQGVWNFSSLGAKGAIGQEDDEAGNPGGFPIGNLGIEDGQVALTDRQSAGNRAVYRDIDLVLKNLAGENASVDLSIRLPGEGEQRVQLKGTGGPINLERLVATPFEGRLELNQVRLGGLREFLQSQMLAEMDGTLNGQAQISLQLGALVTDGEITVQDARFATTDLGQPIRAQYLVSTDFEKEEITVKKGILGLGGSSALSVDGSVNLQSDPARLGLRLRADGLSLQEFARLAPALGLSLPPATEIKGQLNADVRVLGTTEQPTAEGSCTLSNLQVSGEQIPQPIEIHAIRFSLTPDKLQSDDFQIKSGQTTIASRVALNGYFSDTPEIDARLEAPKAELGALLALARAYGVTALNNLDGEGALSLDYRLTGPVPSLSGDELLRALHGKSNINFQNLRVSGANLTQEVAAVAGFLKPVASTGEKITRISEMTGTVTVQNGIAQTNDLKAVLDLGKIAVKGTANLVNHSLNLRINAIVDEEISRKAGGTGIDGYLKTALENKAGEIVVPVLVTGRFEDPKVTPDLETVAEMRLRDVLPDSNNPAAGLPGVIGDILKGRTPAGKPGEQQPRTSPNEKTPGKEKNVIEQIFKGLSGKQEKEKQPPEKNQPE